MSKLQTNRIAREDCDKCNGTGMLFPDCETCHGDGWVDDPSDGGTMTCPECKAEECPYCEL